MQKKPITIEDYIGQFPSETQLRLRKLQSIVYKEVPNAVESLAYGIIAYKLNGKPLVYFGGYENHIGFYATPTAQAHFYHELIGYKQGKGSVQFPLNTKMPITLIRNMIQFKRNELRQQKK